MYAWNAEKLNFCFFQRLRDENELLHAEEQLKMRETRLLFDKYRLDARHTIDDVPLKARYGSAMAKLNAEKSKLNSELNKVRFAHSPLIWAEKK